MLTHFFNVQGYLRVMTKSLLEERIYAAMNEKLADNPEYDCTFTTDEVSRFIQGYRSVIDPRENEIVITEHAPGMMIQTVFTYNGSTWDYEGTSTPIGIGAVCKPY